MRQRELRRGVRSMLQRGGLSIIVGVGLGALIFGVVLMLPRRRWSQSHT
jgi:hypothetical protein